MVLCRSVAAAHRADRQHQYLGMQDIIFSSRLTIHTKHKHSCMQMSVAMCVHCQELGRLTEQQLATYQHCVAAAARPHC